MKINVSQAALGDTVTVPTLDGDRQITVPAGTQSGAIFRLRNMGVPQLRGGARGDQLVVTQVAIPKRLTEEQKELFQKLGTTLGTEVVLEDKQSFVDRVREALGL